MSNGKYIFLIITIMLAACDGPRRETNKPVVETEPVTWIYADDCPDWRDGEHATNYANTTFPNFGCATAHNIGQVLENPNDYINGKGYDGTADAERAIRVLVPYREPAADLASGSSGGDG